MQDILNNLVDSRILNLLEIININYPDKFKKTDIETEITYIKKHINWKTQNIKTTYVKKNKDNKDIKKNKIKKNLIKLNKHSKIKEKEKKKEKEKEKEIDIQCSGRTWSDYILNKNTMKKINDIDEKFKVNDYNILDLKDFNSKYIIGLRCSKKHIENSKYCKLHSKHLIHGNYLEIPNKELCYHFIKDGKYL